MHDLVIASRTEAGKLLLSTNTGPTFKHLISIYSNHSDGFSGGSKPCAGHWSIPKEDKLYLQFDDVDDTEWARENHYTPVSMNDIKRIVEFAHIIEGKTLIHCYAGISRSTATGIIVRYIQQENRDEAEAMEYIYRIRPIASPNLLMLSYADQYLGSRFFATITRSKI